MSRVGNFSSSSIWKLTKLGRNKKDFGQIALTYIKEKSYEKKLGRSLDNFVHSRPTSWGTFCEHIAFEELEGWELVSEDRLKHPDTDLWTGIPDLVAEGRVGDIKCPWTLKSFCDLVECKSGEDLKKTAEAYYWQLVSNAILTGVDKAFLYVWCPYKGQLNSIRERALKSGIDFVTWMQYAEDKDYPYLILGNEYSSMNEIQFTVPEEDKEFLTQQVFKAVELL